MKKQSKSRFSAGSWSYLWLAIACVLMIFSDGQWTCALAPWFALPLLLRFVRLQKPVVGYFITVGVMTISSYIAWYGLFPIPWYFNVLIYLIPAFFKALPYLADRLIYRRVQGFLATLIFPIAITAMQFFSSFRSDNGTYGSLAYTQYGILPLIQLPSVTGIWGLVFLVAWFASIVNYCWEKGFTFAKIKKAVVIYVCILVAVFAYGGARLVLIKPAETKVRVAAVTTPVDILGKIVKSIEGESQFNLSESLAILEAQTVQAADAGAKIVVWQEYSDLISRQDMDVFIKRAQKIAAAKKIYLLIGVGVMDSKLKEKGENTAIFIDPAGEIKWKHVKSYLVPILEGPFFKQGERKIPVLDTPYGKIASVICFEYDHHHYVRSAGQGITLFLVPALDGKTLTPVHSHMAVFRGIENGYSVLKPTGEGLSIAADYCGRIIAKQNYVASEERIMLADMPVKSVFTIYSIIGDVFAWVCVIGLIAFIIVAVIRRKRG